MDDINSRHNCETIILDRKIASLQGLREKWKETENQLRELSASLQQYEGNDFITIFFFEIILVKYFCKIFKVALSKLESSDELSEVTKLNAEISSLDVVLVSCEHSVINLEQHIDTATRLSARVANIRSRYETLKQRNAAA